MNDCTSQVTVVEPEALDILCHTSYFVLRMGKLRPRGAVRALEIKLPDAHPDALPFECQEPTLPP